MQTSSELQRLSASAVKVLDHYLIVTKAPEKTFVRIELRQLPGKPQCTAETVTNPTTGRKIRTCKGRAAQSIVVVLSQTGGYYRAWRYCDDHGGLAAMELELLRFLERHEAKESINCDGVWQAT
jgi:hypothetical protein